MLNIQINVVVRTVHNIQESVGNPDSEVANKAACLAEIQNLKKYIEMIGWCMVDKLTCAMTFAGICYIYIVMK